jgi:hypothetical protein
LSGLSAKLKPGDAIGALLLNGPAYPIVYDCGAHLLVTARHVGDTAAVLAAKRHTLTPGVENISSCDLCPHNPSR